MTYPWPVHFHSDMVFIRIISGKLNQRLPIAKTDLKNSLRLSAEYGRDINLVRIMISQLQSIYRKQFIYCLPLSPGNSAPAYDEGSDWLAGGIDLAEGSGSDQVEYS